MQTVSARSGPSARSARVTGTSGSSSGSFRLMAASTSAGVKRSRSWKRIVMRRCRGNRSAVLVDLVDRKELPLEPLSGGAVEGDGLEVLPHAPDAQPAALGQQVHPVGH